jgi:hypothetical protein
VKVAELAQSRGEPWYIVLEDDATFTLDDWRRFAQLLPLLWNMRGSWDIFNGGPGHLTGFELIRSDPILYKIKAQLAHFLIVNSSAYDLIKAWAPEKEAIDEYFKRHTKMIGTYPFIAAQLKGTSDIGIGDPVSAQNDAQNIIKNESFICKRGNDLCRFENIIR